MSERKEVRVPVWGEGPVPPTFTHLYGKGDLLAAATLHNRRLIRWEVQDLRDGSVIASGLSRSPDIAWAECNTAALSVIG